MCSSAKPDEYMKQVLTSWKTFSQTMSREQFLQARTPWLFTHRFYENPGAHEAYRERVLSNPYPQTQAGFARQCEATLEHDTLDRIHSIESPTHVIVGAEDILIPPAIPAWWPREFRAPGLQLFPPPVIVFSGKRPTNSTRPLSVGSRSSAKGPTWYNRRVQE